MITNILKKKSLNNNAKIIGVAGTRGKTITSLMLHHILKNRFDNVALLNSSGYKLFGEDGNDLNIHNSTNKDIRSFIEQSDQDNNSYIILEVTSRNIKNGLYDGITFDGGIITNLYDDNLEFYRNSQDYIDTKINFLKSIRDNGILVVDESAEEVISQYGNKIKHNVYYESISPKDATEIVLHPDGIDFFYKNDAVNLKSLGLYNIENALSSLSLVELLTEELEHKALSNFKTPEGRMDVLNHNGIKYVIDYSYQPDMIRDSLRHLAETKIEGSRIIAVGGSAGRRNPARRSIGKYLAKFADIVVLVAEDPKDEDVGKINLEILQHAEGEGGVAIEEFSSQENFEIIDKEKLRNKIERVCSYGDVPFLLFNANDFSSRLNGIEIATQIARIGDIVYIFGKGHEQTMFFEDDEYAWSDYKALEEIMKKNSNL